MRQHLQCQQSTEFCVGTVMLRTISKKAAFLATTLAERLRTRAGAKKARVRILEGRVNRV